MKMIVTGSEGFIGKALCQELKRRDVEVTGKTARMPQAFATSSKTEI